MRLRVGGRRSVLLPARSEGLHRSQLLPRPRPALRRARRLCAGVRHRARSRTSRPEPVRRASGSRWRQTRSRSSRNFRRIAWPACGDVPPADASTSKKATSKKALARRKRSVTTAFSADPAAASCRNPSRTDRQRSVSTRSGGDSRARTSRAAASDRASGLLLTGGAPCTSASPATPAIHTDEIVRVFATSGQRILVEHHEIGPATRRQRADVLTADGARRVNRRRAQAPAPASFLHRPSSPSPDARRTPGSALEMRPSPFP